MFRTWLKQEIIDKLEELQGETIKLMHDRQDEGLYAEEEEEALEVLEEAERKIKAI